LGAMLPSTPLNPAAASPLYLQLQRTLRGLIQGNEWNPGHRLPPVPELAERFKVHRLTVLKALAGLKRTENEARLIKRYDEVCEYLLLPAFLILVGEVCLNQRRRRKT